MVASLAVPLTLTMDCLPRNHLLHILKKEEDGFEEYKVGRGDYHVISELKGYYYNGNNNDIIRGTISNINSTHNW